MASERDQVRESVADREPSDGDLDTALSKAHQIQHSLDKDRESNRHKEAKLDKWISTAPVAVAAVVVVLGFAVFFIAMAAAHGSSDQAEFWAKQGERGLGVATAALAYIFGKGAR